MIHTIGNIAKSLIDQEQEAVVLGRTSRGIFLRLDCGWIIFLSWEAHRGPLTLNVSGDPGSIPAGPTSPAQVTHQGILFPDQHVLLSTGQARVWTSPERLAQALPAEKRSRVLERVTRSVISQRKTAGYSHLLTLLASSQALPDHGGEPILSRLQNLRASLASRQVPAIAASLEPFLGSGTGLTPSGDDLVLGLLLALNRWEDVLAPDLEVTSLNRAILPQAYRKTTRLSANLIECACQGQADERLIIALDALMTGVPGPLAAAALLASWGNSSGCDALIGMALAQSESMKIA